MSWFREEITLENPVDATNAVEGIIKETEVRRLTVKALVDTGAWTLVINEATRKKLGLRILGPGTSEVANGVVESGFHTEGVNIYWQDRHTVCEAFVLPNETEVLFGALPLEGMDLMVYPKGEKLIGAHGDQPLRIVKQGPGAVYPLYVPGVLGGNKAISVTSPAYTASTIGKTAAQILSGTHAFFGSAPNGLFPAALSATLWLPASAYTGITGGGTGGYTATVTASLAGYAPGGGNRLAQ